MAPSIVVNCACDCYSHHFWRISFQLTLTWSKRKPFVKHSNKILCDRQHQTLKPRSAKSVSFSARSHTHTHTHRKSFLSALETIENVCTKIFSQYENYKQNKINKLTNEKKIVLASILNIQHKSCAMLTTPFFHTTNCEWEKIFSWYETRS